MASNKKCDINWRENKHFNDIEMEDLSDPFLICTKDELDVDMAYLSGPCGGICNTSVCEKQLSTSNLKPIVEECFLEIITKMLSLLKISN